MCVRVELNSFVKGLEYARIIIVLTHLIGHNAPVTEAQNGAQIELMYLDTLIPFVLRCIGQPFLVGLFRMKLAIEKIFNKMLRVLGLLGATVVIVFYSRPYIAGPTNM